MTFALTSWLALSFVLGVIALWAVWARTESKYRYLSFLAFFVGIPLAAPPIAVSMGWSMPCKYALYGWAEEYDIVGYKAVPESIIYLFVDTSYGPKVCDIPWSTTDAEQLKEGSKKGGTGSKMKGTGAFEAPGDPNIWNPPPEANLPPKEGDSV